MSADRPLAEIVAEGRAMCRPDWQGPKGYRDTFIAEHFARLLAVAEAALVLRNAMGSDWPLSLRDEIAAFDDAAGAREGEGRK